MLTKSKQSIQIGDLTNSLNYTVKSEFKRSFWFFNEQVIRENC